MSNTNGQSTNMNALFADLWKLINECMVEHGDMIWLTDGCSPHERLADLAALYAPEVATALQARLHNGDELYFSAGAPDADHRALADALTNGNQWRTLADLWSRTHRSAYLPRNPAALRKVLAAAAELRALDGEPRQLAA